MSQLEIIEVMNQKAGVRDDDDKRRAYRQAITENQRKREETLSQFAVRRQREFRNAANYGVQIPDALKAMLLREGASLTDQSHQNLVALLQGREDEPDMVAQALAKLDVRTDRLTVFTEDTFDEPSYLTSVDEEAPDDDESLNDEEVMKELEGLELTEDQVSEVYAVLDQRRRTWRENKILKADIKKDRGAFTKDGGLSHPRGQSGGTPGGGVGRRPAGRSRGHRDQMNREQLKKISKCRLCLKVGHWAEDCHKQKSPPTAFSYCGSTSSMSSSAFSFLGVHDLRAALDQVLGRVGSGDRDCWSFLSLPSGEAVLDIGATQDLIGEKALEEMTEVLHAAGLQPVRIDKIGSTPSGIGGAAKPLYTVLLPIAPGGVPGVLEMLVLEGGIPPLLSVGFLDFLKASINLEDNVIKFGALGLELPMRKLVTGHRTIPMVQWKGGSFPVPVDVQKKYGLSSSAFDFDHQSVSCAYTKNAADLAAECFSVVGTSHDANFHEDLQQNEPNTKSTPFSSDVNHKTTTQSAQPHVETEPKLMNRLEVKGSATCVLGATLDSRLQDQATSSDLMGNSPTSPKFDIADSRHGTKRLSPESREQRAATFGAATMDDADACCGHHAGGISPELCDPDQVRDAHQEDSRNEVPDACWSRGGNLPSPGGLGDQPLQPVCSLDSMSTVRGKTELPLQNPSIHSSTQSAGISQHHEDKHRDTGDDDCNTCHRSANRQRVHPHCPNIQRGELHAAPAPSHAGAECAGGSHDESGQSIPPRTGSRTSSDAAGSPGQCNERGQLVSGSSPLLGSIHDLSHGEPQRGAVKRWPTWMIASGLVLTSTLLTWDQCSPALRQRLQEVGCDSKEYYLFQYDLAGELSAPEGPVPPLESHAEYPDPPKSSNRPSWLPSYVRERSVNLKQTKKLEPYPTDDWCCVWRQVQDMHSGEIIENCPGPHSTLDFGTPLDLRVCYWGLPLDFVRLSTLTSDESCPISLDSRGNLSQHGQFWAVPSDLLDSEVVGSRLDPTQDVGSPSDIRRCATRLCFMARQLQHQEAQHLDFVELFSPPRVAPVAQQLGLRVDLERVFDLQAGWDVRRKEHRQTFRKFQKKHRPRNLMASPECRAFTPLQHINKNKMRPEQWRELLVEGTLMWDFSLEAIEAQLQHNDYFTLEHPERAASWKLPQTQELLGRDDVAVIISDQCQWGLSVVNDGELSKKPTKFATNNPWLALRLSEAQCQGDHPHRHLLGGLPSKAQVYPPALCQCLAEAAQASTFGFSPPTFIANHRSINSENFNGFGEGDLEEELDAEVERAGRPLPRVQQPEDRPQVSEQQKRLIHRVHVNTGHPPRDRFLRALRAAGALPHVLDYVKTQYTCDDCQVKHRPDVHRKVQLPKTYSFNKILCLDHFFLKWQDQNIAVLNMVDLGTGYQIAVRSPIAEGTHGGAPSSQTTWRQLITTWFRYFGTPQLIVCDAGNEFKGHFERSLENYGIFQHVIHPESPSENGRAQRHGGWLKERLDRELQSGRGVIQTLEDLDELLSGLTTAKNSWLNRGGYTPSQLVFGQLPRVPNELLADDELAQHGIEDAFSDPMQVDEAAGEFRKRHLIRERARKLALADDCKHAIHGAAKAAPHQDRQWTPGQWVYVYRRAKATQELHLRDRWVGPGVVILANNNTVYVGMRSRLWRCASEQLRPALSSEVLGRDLASDPGLASLLHRVVSAQRAGAVNVAREGAPPADAQFRQVEEVADGVEALPQQPPQVPEAPDEPSQAPQPVARVPPGLLPVPRPEIQPVESRNTSRRSSTQEPASEPGILAGPPGLEAIPEEPSTPHSGIPHPEEPPHKAARVESATQSSLTGDQAASSSSSSATPRLPTAPMQSSRGHQGPWNSSQSSSRSNSTRKVSSQSFS